MANPKTKLTISGHDVIVSQSPNKSPFERFLMINQDQLLAFANNRDLPILMRVQNLILASCERGNFIDLAPTEVANYLGCSKSAASKALAFWEQQGLFIKKRRTGIVNPLVAWKGTTEEHQAALRLVHG